MSTDPIADMLCAVKNAILKRTDNVTVPSSGVKANIAQVLKDEGYISAFDISTKRNRKVLRLVLKYDKKKVSVIKGIKGKSSPGRHLYVTARELPRVQGGFGTAVVSTSKGVMTDRQAREAKIGGEVLCYVW